MEVKVFNLHNGVLKIMKHSKLLQISKKKKTKKKCAIMLTVIFFLGGKIVVFFFINSFPYFLIFLKISNSAIGGNKLFKVGYLEYRMGFFIKTKHIS